MMSTRPLGACSRFFAGGGQVNPLLQNYLLMLITILESPITYNLLTLYFFSMKRRVHSTRNFVFILESFPQKWVVLLDYSTIEESPWDVEVKLQHDTNFGLLCLWIHLIYSLVIFSISLPITSVGIYLS
jgi:hypothetical protein